MTINRYNAKRDANEKIIVDFFKRCGFSVERLSAKNIPDLLIGTTKRNYLIEVKSEGEKLTLGQRSWHGSWQGQVAVVKNLEDAQNFVYNEVFRGIKEGENEKEGIKRKEASSP